MPGSSTSYAYNPANGICWSYAGSSSAGCGSPPAGADSYSYDADGNETSNGNGLTLAYNPLGQMTSATSAGASTSYSYLGEGQNQLYGIGTSQQLENSLLGVISQGTGTPASTTYYTRAQNGRLIDERTPSGTYNYLYDGNGDIIALTDSSGHLVDQYAYDPYGNTTTNIGSVANSFGYHAGYTTSAGLIHYGARYLNPAQASWTQQDPLNHITSLTQTDRYTYAGDNPINLSDPTGACFVVSCRTYHAVGNYISRNAEALGEIGLGVGVATIGVAATGVCYYFTRGTEPECAKPAIYGGAAGGFAIAEGASRLR
ncbi:MAG: RHS repeat-associated core domain-containing protein [Solirubrobacteraceae bacterium]